jgi:hypothetical protein
MPKTMITFLAAGVLALLLSACAGDNYNARHHSYESRNDREINNAINEEVNSLSQKDIAQLNKLK